MMTNETYNLYKRATETAKDLIAELCDFEKAKQQNTVESWEAYIESLDDLDVSDLAHTEADSWDWVIYYHHAISLIQSGYVHGAEIDEAEDMLSDCHDGSYIDFWDHCTKLAYWLVYNAMTGALQDEIDACRELAEVRAKMAGYLKELGVDA